MSQLRSYLRRLFYFNVAYMNLNWDINILYDIAYVKLIFNCIIKPTSFSSESLVFQRPRQKEPRHSTASRDGFKVMLNFEVLIIGILASQSYPFW